MKCALDLCSYLTQKLTIFTCIEDVLIRCALPLSQCRDQAFDGALNMSGIRNGVQALIKEEEHSLYVHCLAHNLNLCIQSTTKQSVVMRNVMEFL